MKLRHEIIAGLTLLIVAGIAVCQQGNHLDLKEYTNLVAGNLNESLTGKINALRSDIVDTLEPKSEDQGTTDQNLKEYQEYDKSKQACQDCIDWYYTHAAARKQFQRCNSQVYFSTQMDTVCQFTMQTKLPSGREIDYVCPPFNNEHCPGPLWVPSNP